MPLPLSLHYLYILFSTSNICFSPYYFSIALQIVTIKKARSGKLYNNFDLQTSPTKFARVVGFDKNSHAQALHFQVTKSQLKFSILMKKKIQSLSTKQAQFSRLAAVMSIFCAKQRGSEVNNLQCDRYNTE